MNADLMFHPATLGPEPSVFGSGNDTAAHATVTGPLASIGHTGVIDLGTISRARGTEMLLTGGCASGPRQRGVQRQKSSAEMSTMTGKTVLVTGASGGIGLATAAGLAQLGARVGLVGRDAARSEAAAERLRAAGGQVDVFVADMSSQREVRRLAEEVLTAYPRLDVLVNNVGGYWATRHATVDGLEHTFAVNHLAPFLLTNLLLDRLRASAPARVVTVSSGAHAMGIIDFEDLQGERVYSGERAYNQSKLANVMFTYELARRLQGVGRHREHAPPGRGPHQLRARGLQGLDAPDAAGHPPVPEEPGQGGRDVGVPRILPRGARRDRSVLREAEGQALLNGLLRRHRRSPALGRLRDAGRPLTGTRRPPTLQQSLVHRSLAEGSTSQWRSVQGHGRSIQDVRRHRCDGVRLMARAPLARVGSSRTNTRPDAVKRSGWRRCDALRGGGLSAADSRPPAAAAPAAAGAPRDHVGLDAEPLTSDPALQADREEAVVGAGENADSYGRPHREGTYRFKGDVGLGALIRLAFGRGLGVDIVQEVGRHVEGAVATGAAASAWASSAPV